MKKAFALLLAAGLVVSTLTGCGKSAEPAKTGLSVITSIAKSKDASAEGDGLAEVDSTVVAVLVGKDGKILDCKIDVAQTKMNFSTEGKLTTDIATVFQSKQELGDAYGMKKASGISKEWFEQANAFADYVVGKTVDEVKGIAVNEDGTAKDADLAASVTVHINEFVEGVEKAVAASQELGAQKGDKLGLAITTDMSKSTDASAEGDGLAQAYSNYAVVTVDKNNKITSCVIDASQGNVNFNTEGVITTDLATTYQTKQELKEAYGMKKASGIGKEWYEQANAFADYVTGKKLDEVKGIAVNEDGTAKDADLASSVTVHVAPFIANVDKAVANAAK
ncbi:hypothetical protein H0486_02125 [Lachnospiraceae bacterium MD1]|uniref:Uncharacterized protein n=1 Tax=Variimorphobacter saccharofermentans TaxID=2755051 RepID=A0A839JVK9_9FIRM|nr:hypothetical protein [Variimorphobacter saccharofermentans]MBB2181673.1 hypothetical protein [Variimorphobacter saccharofermentans]